MTWTFFSFLRDSPDVRLLPPGVTFLYETEATGMPPLLVNQWILRLNKTWTTLFILDVKLDPWMRNFPTDPHDLWKAKYWKVGDVRYRNHRPTLGSFGCHASTSTLREKGMRPAGNCRPPSHHHGHNKATEVRYSQDNFQFWARTTWMESYNNILFLEDRNW